MPNAVLEPPPARPTVKALEPARFTVDQYHRMIECGALTEDDRVELLDGMLVTKVPQGVPHVEVLEELVSRCQEAFEPGTYIKTEKPVTLPTSEPETDVAVVRGRRADYAGRHPAGEDCLLVIEVSGSSLANGILKADLYAAGGVPEDWIVDIAGRTITVHRGPSPGGYRDVSEGKSAEAALPCGTLSMAADDLLGERGVSTP